jgi:hypothetical protein
LIGCATAGRSSRRGAGRASPLYIVDEPRS